MSDDKKITLPTQVLLDLMENNENPTLSLESFKEDPFISVVKWIRDTGLQSGQEWIRPRTLYISYKAWAETTEAFVATENKFGELMTKMFPKRGRNGKMFYLVNKKTGDEKKETQKEATKKD